MKLKIEERVIEEAKVAIEEAEKAEFVNKSTLKKCKIAIALSSLRSLKKRAL
jgi:hypothetical protein